MVLLYGNYNGPPEDILEDKYLEVISNPKDEGEAWLDIKKKINEIDFKSFYIRTCSITKDLIWYDYGSYTKFFYLVNDN